MTMFKSFVAAVLIAGFATAPVASQKGRRGEQDALYEATKQGTIRSLRSIENAIVPGMTARGADYIGAEFNREQLFYRLKFMRRSAVIWVDVDGRSGEIIGRAGG